MQYVFGKHRAQLPRTADVQVLEGVFVLKNQLKEGDLERYPKGDSTKAGALASKSPAYPVHKVS